MEHTYSKDLKSALQLQSYASQKAFEKDFGSVLLKDYGVSLSNEDLKEAILNVDALLAAFV